jgi:hypothetical protein
LVPSWLAAIHLWLAAYEEESLVPVGGNTETEADLEVQEESTPPYQLKLPDEMLAALQESIQSAVETLMDQSETLLGFSEPCVSDSIHGGDDVSTLRTGYVSVANSTATGRNSLKTRMGALRVVMASFHCGWSVASFRRAFAETGTSEKASRLFFFFFGYRPG